MSTNGSTSLSTFAGLRNANQNNNTNTQELEQADFWLNIGYATTVTNKDEKGKNVDEVVFVSLARGIPLDQIKAFDIGKARTTNMAALREAQNDLHDMFMAEAGKLEPGESKIIIQDDATGLGVELKRVKGAVEAPKENALKREIKFRSAETPAE